MMIETFFKKLYYDNDVFDQAKAKAKNSLNPPVAATKGLVRPLDVFPNDVFESRKISDS